MANYASAHSLAYPLAWLESTNLQQPFGTSLGIPATFVIALDGREMKRMTGQFDAAPLDAMMRAAGYAGAK